jgi:hypothetical protein
VKPTALPPDTVWQEWPTLETLHAETGLSVGKLRMRLVRVPCYRCPDKSVRYNPAIAREAITAYEHGAISGVVDAEDEDDAAEAPTRASNDNGNVSIDANVLLLRMLGDSRKDKADAIRAMQAPLETGLTMMKEAMAIQVATNSIQSKRLEHLEGLWDRMVELSEAMIASAAQRELVDRTHADSLALKKRTFELVKDQLPAMLGRWTLTTEASLAMDFLGSLNPMILDHVIESGVLDPDQVAKLTKLRAQLALRQKKPANDVPKPQDQESEPHAATMP